MSDIKITAQNVQSGQVFYCSWGMEQTNIDWYQIVTVSDSKKSARFRQIHSVKVSDGPQTMTGQSMPDIGNYLEEGPFMKILKE